MKPTEIVIEIDALAGHFIRPVRSSDEHQRWLADYVESLKTIPEHALKAACRSWRDDERNTKVPTPGQLLALSRQFLSERKQAPEQSKPWAELDDPAYERLSLREKIRYQQIAASEAHKKAGPLWLNGRPATLEELPLDRAERWRSWNAQAQRHYDELDRLQGLLAKAERRA